MIFSPVPFPATLMLEGVEGILVGSLFSTPLRFTPILYAEVVKALKLLYEEHGHCNRDELIRAVRARFSVVGLEDHCRAVVTLCGAPRQPYWLSRRGADDPLFRAKNKGSTGAPETAHWMTRYHVQHHEELLKLSIKAATQCSWHNRGTATRSKQL